MKWHSILSASSLVAAALAGSVAGREPPKRDISERYNLRIADGYGELEDAYLGLNNSKIGVYGTDDSASRIEVYLGGVDGDADAYSLHPFPVGFVPHALALTGKNGWLSFEDVATISGRPATSTDEAVTTSWNEFRLGDKDKSGALALQWRDEKARPGWVANPAKGGAGWEIKHYDGSGFVVQIYQPVKIVLQPVEE